MPIRAWDGVPRNSLKKPTSLAVVGDSTVEGLARVIDQATILPSKGASSGRATPPATAWKPLTWPSTRQGVISTLLTIFPGQEAGGVSEVWPSTTTRNGAESALPGATIATRVANRQAKRATSAQARPLPLCFARKGLNSGKHAA